MLELDAAKATEQLTDFLKKTFEKANFSHAVIGLSGGIDSATSLALTLKALGSDNVYPILMPCGALSTDDVLDAMSIIETFKLPISHVTRIDIKQAYDDIFRSLKEFSLDNVRRGNIMARLRMTILFDQAKKHQALVVGTENKSEQMLGYFTRFGDEASDIEPLMNLYKTQVRILAKYLGIPDKIINKAPTAGLWPDQTDEGELGFTYAEADRILAMIYDEKKSEAEVIKSGFNEELVKKVINRVKQNEFKHRLPYVMERPKNL